MSTSVSSVSTNFFTSPQNGFTTTTSGSVGSAAATVGLNSVAGYSNGDVDVWVIDPTDTNKKQSFTGVVDTAGSQVTSVRWTAGTNQTHALGATVVAYTTATHQALATKGILQQHTQAGAHKSITTDTIVTSGNVTIGGSLTEAGAVHSTMRAETVFDHINSGCVWSGDAYASTRNASCTSGVVYLSGKRLTVAAVTARSFTASKDVYCDLKDNGDGTAVWVYYDNTTGAASPTFVTTGGTLRGSIIAVGATNIPNAAAIRQSGLDTLGNYIAANNPILGKNGAWIAPTLTNSWVNYAGGFDTVGYMKDALGFVHLKGFAKLGTVGTTIFTLPAGFRPPLVRRWATDSNASYGSITVDSAGNVQSAGSNVWVALDPVIFRAEL